MSVRAHICMCHIKFKWENQMKAGREKERKHERKNYWKLFSSTMSTIWTRKNSLSNVRAKRREWLNRCASQLDRNRQETSVAFECVYCLPQNTHTHTRKLKNHEIIKQHESTISFGKRQQFNSRTSILKRIDKPNKKSSKTNRFERIIFDIACGKLFERCVKIVLGHANTYGFLFRNGE